MASTESKQTGGKRIGSGRYGCVFDPPLLCMKKTKKPGEKNFVGKLTNKEDGDREFSMSETLRSIPDATRYFILIEDSCVPKPRSQQPDPDLNKCSIASGEKYNSMIQLIMPYAGKTLQSLSKRATNLDFFIVGQHLLEATTYLLMKGIVHMDLHSQNVVATNPFTPKIIDFGAAYKPSQLNALTYRQVLRSYNPSVVQEPPEMTVINALESNVPEPVAIAAIGQYKDVLGFVSGVSNLSTEAQLRQLRKFLHSSASYHQRNWLSFFQVYWSKVDAWGIGALLLYLFTYMSMDPAFESSQVVQDKIPMAIQVMTGLCNMDAGLRLDCAEALALWAPDSKALKQQEVQTWLTNAAKQRAALQLKTSS
jgi:hypothetical protein